MAAVPSIGRADRPAAAPREEAELTRALYERHATQIFRYCRHRLGSREEAEDAVQSTFLNAFRGIKRGVVPEHESAWLLKIAENVCLSRRRSSWRRGRVESPTDFDLVEEHASAPTRLADELLGLHDVLARMTEGQRRAILLREWQGLSYREIAEELQLSQTAVETLIFRARRSLATGLEAPPEPVRKRRMVRASDLGNILTALKSFLIGGAATAKVVAVVAVVGAGTVVASSPAHEHHSSAPATKAVAHAVVPVVRATHAAVTAPPAHVKPQQHRHSPVPPRSSTAHTPFLSAGTKSTVAADAPAAPAVAPAPAPRPAPAPPAEHDTTAPVVAQAPPSSSSSTETLPPPDQSGYGRGDDGSAGQDDGQGQSNGNRQGLGWNAPTQGPSTPTPTPPPTASSPTQPVTSPSTPTNPGNDRSGPRTDTGGDGQPSGSGNGSGSGWSGVGNGRGDGGDAGLRGHDR